MAKKRKAQHISTSGQKPGPAKRNWVPGIFLALLFAFLTTAVVQVEMLLSNKKSLHPLHLGGLIGIIIVTFFLANLYLNKFEKEVTESRRSLAKYGIIMLLLIVVGRMLMVAKWLPFLTPCALAAMIFAIVYNQRFSITTMLLLCLFVAMQFKPHVNGWTEFDFHFPLFVGLAGGSVAAIFGVAHIRTRTRLISVGLLSGIVTFVSIIAASLLEYGESHTAWDFWRNTLKYGGLGFANNFVCGFLMTGLLPFIEQVFDITTDLSLIELSDLNQPVLREFSLIAPGTYHHSLRVAQLAEAAAEVIGANPLLARVGSYFHDVGKRAKPEYYTENEMGRGSRHERLSPALSTLIIVSHSKDGVEIIRELGLPKKVIDIAAMHHGTSLVEYFYHEAKEEYGENGEEVQEGAFRYPGPKPAFKEAGIILLADAIEAASRTLDDPSPARIENLVEAITTRKLMDKQLDDSQLTLTDLKNIKERFIRVLTAMFHSRVKYPTTENELNKKEIPEEKKEPEKEPDQEKKDEENTGEN
ncbi:MAG: HD family phosphohydrolase [Planctomycetota bacterium]|jgi:putative nucleotidyltransferase with HDIG domain